jgi:hypothetical protein
MTAKASGDLLAAVFALIILVVARRPIRVMAYLATRVGLACLVVRVAMGLEVRTPSGWPVPLPAAMYWLQVADLAHKSAGGRPHS